MTISEVEPDLRQIIQTLRDGNLETAEDRTVELIECTCRMSGPCTARKTSARFASADPGVQECSCEVENPDQGSARGVVHNAAWHAGRCRSNGGTGAQRLPGRRTRSGEIEHCVDATRLVGADFGMARTR